MIVGMDAIFQTDVMNYSKKRQEDSLQTLELVKALNEGAENSAEWELIDALKWEKINDVKGLIDGMEKEIERAITVELMDRKLDTVKIEVL